MHFLIADTFTDSLGRLTGDEQKAVKTTVFDLQLNPANPGHNFHKLDRAKDKCFWSVRVSSDVRVIVHRTQRSLLVCYVDHHDKAYNWAERRKLQSHPQTGAAQLVEIRETVQEIVVPTYVESRQPTKPKPELLFAHIPDDDLLQLGVPAEWLADVRQATDDSILTLVDHLPAEAAEALLELATGGKPLVPQPVVVPSAGHEPAAAPEPSIDAVPDVAFEHPDAKRRFWAVEDSDDLQQALEYPWDKWMVFLHPDQRRWVDADFAGPARLSGSAGTGKTIVALHRAVHLARANPDARVLLTTFTDTLANSLSSRLKRLASNQPRLIERLDVHSIRSLGERLYKSHFGPARLATDDVIVDVLTVASQAAGEHKHSLRFLKAEWAQVVDAWQLDSWEAYRDVERLGRKTRLPEPQRAALWSIFEKARAELHERGVVTESGVFHRLSQALTTSNKPPFDFAVIDEAQDFSVAHLRFLAALGGHRRNGLFLTGDLGQRIFQQPFSWRGLGVDIRGRSHTLRVSYRTSHQIRRCADRLLGAEISDMDGNTEKRGDTVSTYGGPEPSVRKFADQDQETAAVSNWLRDQTAAGISASEIGVIVRSAAELARARLAVESADLAYRVLNESPSAPAHAHVSIATMHLAKGLEFRAVAVMACDDEVIPSQQRLETAGDESDLAEVYDTERHLLYVACTRARDRLFVSGVEPASEFLSDLQQRLN